MGQRAVDVTRHRHADAAELEGAQGEDQVGGDVAEVAVALGNGDLGGNRGEGKGCVFKEGLGRHGIPWCKSGRTIPRGAKSWESD